MRKSSDLRRLLQIWSAYHQGQGFLPYPPSRMWIEVTDHCNIRCPLCPNQALAKENKGFMSLALYKKVIDQISSGIHDLNLFHRGEPLLHPLLPEMIRYAQSQGIPCRVHTNGTLLSESLSRKILDSGLGLLSFSIDGTQAAQYEQNRYPAKFEETIEKISSILRLKKERGQTRPITLLQFIGNDQEDPDQHLKKMVAPLKDLGLNRVVFRKAHNWGGAIGLNSGSSRSGRALSACTFPWYALVVFWNGLVSPCPQDFFGRLQIGDLNTTPIAEVWNGSLLERLRATISHRRYDQFHPCDQCDRPRRKTFFGVPIEYLKTFLKENLTKKS